MRTKRRISNEEARKRLVLWKQPIKTTMYASKELFVKLIDLKKLMMQHKVIVFTTIFMAVLWTLLLIIDGPHRIHIAALQKKFGWCLYWIGLGVLSSVGLGTGLHTFVLYLGPFIAAVTIAAYECNSLDFPEPPFPDDIICPDGIFPPDNVSLLKIMSKVRLPAMMWGAGTALGELPPYFMARASRLSGYENEDKDDLREFQQLQLKKENNEKLSWIDRLKLNIEKVVETMGFVGILVCASIPNPLFDLAGITCGHFLVPFWTFFGATLLGKAIIKTHIQQVFVIIVFNENLIQNAVQLIAKLPVLGQKLQKPFIEYLASQKLQLHGDSKKESVGGSGSMIAWLLEKIVIVMVLYFLISIVNALAQSHHKRLCKEKRHLKLAED